MLLDAIFEPVNFRNEIIWKRTSGHSDTGKHGRVHYVILYCSIRRRDSRKAAMGVLLSMQEPTRPMRDEAVNAGLYESPTWGRKYPKIQLLTVAELLDGRRVEMPPIRQVNATFK